MKIVFTTILVLIVATQWRCLAFDEKEEAAVYRDYINGHYLSRRFVDKRFTAKPFSLILISELTAGFHHPFSYQDVISELAPKPDPETVSGFLSRNDGYVPISSLSEERIKTVGRYPLNRLLHFRVPHKLISDSEIHEIFSTRGRWDEFYSRYPTSRGIVWLSRVGFNRKMSEALLYFGHQYAEAAGEGYLVLLRKNGGEWQQVAQVSIWVS